MKQIIIFLLLSMTVLALFAIGLQGERYATDGVEFFQRGDYNNAIKSFLLADRAADGKKAEYTFWLGRLHVAIEDTLNAKRWLNVYLDTKDKTFRFDAEAYLEILNRQTLIFEKVSLRDMPKYINSRNSDYGAVVSPAGDYLYFSSLRPTRYDKENIFRAERLNNMWGKPVPVNELNTDKNEAIGSFSNDGKTAYLFGNYERGKLDGDIYISNWNRNWESPVNLGTVNTDLIELQPMVYEDSLLFFVSTRNGGLGGTDIWVSENKGGSWQEPINLGPIINTPQNEQTPFLDWDGKTLFFASTGHAGFGGFDIFKAVKIGDAWTDWSLPENLGLPLNSIKNDRYFYRIKGTNEVFISSDRKSEGFENIFSAFVSYAPREYQIVDATTGKKITIFDDEKKPELSVSDTGEVIPEPVPRFVSFRGTVMDEDDKPLSADVQFSYLTDGSKQQDIASAKEDGSFEVKLPYAERYTATVNLDGCFLHSQEIPAPKDDEVVEINITLQKMAVKKVFVFNNIQFEFESSVLTKDSYPILNEIALTLLNNPDVKVEISGHTCNMGTAKYNLKLSDLRAAAVVEYLLSKGVEKERMISIGYGLTKPIAPNDKIANRQKNRRVEIKVLENNK